MASNPQVRTGKIIQLYPEQLRERKANNRFTFGNLDELSKSIVAHGIINPLIVRKTKDKTDDNYPIYEVVAGHRRLRAARRIATRMEEGDFVPAIVMPDSATEEDVIVASIITDTQGLGRNMLEIGHDIQALLALGKNQTAISKEIGKSAQYVSDCLFLFENATKEILAQIKSGAIGAYTAVDMLKSTPASQVEEAIVKAAGKKSKKIEEESISNPDKKANVKTKLNKSEIEEAHGAPMTEKGKKAASYGGDKNVKQAGGDNTKEDAAVTKLTQLLTTMKANAGNKNTASFQVLNAIIKYMKGTAMALDLMPVFFWGMDEDTDAKFRGALATVEEEATPAKKGKDKAPAKKAAAPAKGKGKKAAAEEEPEIEEVDLDELDEYEEE